MENKNINEIIGFIEQLKVIREEYAVNKEEIGLIELRCRDLNANYQKLCNDFDKLTFGAGVLDHHLVLDYLHKIIGEQITDNTIQAKKTFNKDLIKE